MATQSPTQPVLGAIMVGIDAADPLGTVDTSVLRFTAAAPSFSGFAGVLPAPSNPWLRYLVDAPGGSRFELLRRGMYRVDARIYVQGDINALGGVAAGLSLDATGGVLNAAPAVRLTPGQVFDDAFQLSDAAFAATFWGLKLGGTVGITSQQAYDSTQGLVRAHVTQGDGSPMPLANIVTASTWIRLIRVGDAS
jgi:hypothetical protein